MSEKQDQESSAASVEENPSNTQPSTVSSTENGDIEALEASKAGEGVSSATSPLDWNPKYKWAMVALISSIEFATNLATLICVPAIPDILADLHSSNPSQDSTIIVTIWNLGGIVGMLAIGPLSELYGRRPLYNGANILFVFFAVGSALSTSVGMLITFRFLNGTMLASQALNAGIAGDLFALEQRGRAQALMTVGPLFGPIVGPLAGGFLAEAAGWRWTFWFVAILVAMQEGAFALFYRESYEPAIRRQRAQGTSRGRRKWLSFFRVERTDRDAGVLTQALTRPFRIFVMPIFLVLAVCQVLTYGYLYVLITTMTSVFESQYGFSSGAAGLSYLGIGLGMGAGTYLCMATLDWYTQRMKRRHGGEIRPEWRLPLMVVGGLTMAAGLFIYGWTAQARVQFVVPIIGTALVAFSLSCTNIPITTYLVDVFGDYRASAVSALIVARQAVTIVLPLAGPPLYARLGLGWGNSLLGFIALATIPVPFLILKFGGRLREASKIEKLLAR